MINFVYDAENLPKNKFSVVQLQVMLYLTRANSNTLWKNLQSAQASLDFPTLRFHKYEFYPSSHKVHSTRINAKEELV